VALSSTVPAAPSTVTTARRQLPRVLAADDAGNPELARQSGAVIEQAAGLADQRGAPDHEDRERWCHSSRDHDVARGDGDHRRKRLEPDDPPRDREPVPTP